MFNSQRYEIALCVLRAVNNSARLEYGLYTLGKVEYKVWWRNQEPVKGIGSAVDVKGKMKKYKTLDQVNRGEDHNNQVNSVLVDWAKHYRKHQVVLSKKVMRQGGQDLDMT